MGKSLYLVNPRPDLPSYYGAEVFESRGFAATVGIADLATTTVAAMVPRGWSVSICEEHVEPVDFDTDAEFVGLTGKITQSRRMLQIAREFRRRGKTVICGGPYASLCPEAFRGHCDVLVIGELESLAEQFFGDLADGRWQEEYSCPKPDLATSPMPRWDLYPNGKALVGCVQTSRGCPFECEFCDVIAYLGRHQRHKPVAHVLAELDVLYSLGYRNIFLADDNFTVYRRHAKEVLHGLAQWNRNQKYGPVSFITQVSIDAARDAELVRLCAEAGLNGVFIGIETPNEESLLECKKRQNVRVDLIDALQVFLDNGISVTGGMMVGFDHDGPEIFQHQYDFAMASPVPIFTVGALVAPAATPLFRRLGNESRLLEAGSEVAGAPWDTNVIPARLTRDQLLNGLQWLCHALYVPEQFAIRIITMIDRLERHPLDLRATAGRAPRSVEAAAVMLIKQIEEFGQPEARMLRTVLRAIRTKPHTAGAAMTSLFRYAQVRHLYETGGLWEPRAGNGHSVVS